MKRDTKIVQSIQQINISHSISFHTNIIHKYKFKMGLRAVPILNYLLQHKFSKSMNTIKNSIQISNYKIVKSFIKSQNIISEQEINHQKQFNFIKLNNSILQRVNKSNLYSLSNNSYSQNKNLKKYFEENNEINYQRKINFIKSNNSIFKIENKSILSSITNSIYPQKSSNIEKFISNINTQNSFSNRKINHQKRSNFIKSSSTIFINRNRLTLSSLSNNTYLQNSNTQNHILNTKRYYQQKINHKIASSISQLKTIFLKTNNINKLDKAYEKKVYMRVQNQYSDLKTEQKYINNQSTLIHATNKNQIFQEQQKDKTNKHIDAKNINEDNNIKERINITEKITEHFHHYEIKKLANKIYPIIMKKWQKEFEKRGVFHV